MRKQRNTDGKCFKYFETGENDVYDIKIYKIFFQWSVEKYEYCRECYVLRVSNYEICTCFSKTKNMPIAVEVGVMFGVLLR